MKVFELDQEKLWFKVVDFLQQNWAVIVTRNECTKVLFVSDNSVIFDEIVFDSELEAEAALCRNGFRLFEEDQEARRLIRSPSPPYERGNHPSGPIYSSGRFWK